jgi:Ni/Co efflux regulator RcnB
MKKLFRRNLMTAVLVLSFAAAPVAFAQGDEYSEARNLVQRVQDDLHALHPSEHKDRDRINDVLKHLSDLDRKFTKDKFSKAPLSDAIGKLQDVLDHNTLETRERDTLNADIHDLRELRLYKGR